MPPVVTCVFLPVRPLDAVWGLEPSGAGTAPCRGPAVTRDELREPGGCRVGAAAYRLYGASRLQAVVSQLSPDSRVSLSDDP